MAPWGMHTLEMGRCTHWRIHTLDTGIPKTGFQTMGLGNTLFGIFSTCFGIFVQINGISLLNRLLMIHCSWLMPKGGRSAPGPGGAPGPALELAARQGGCKPWRIHTSDTGIRKRTPIRAMGFQTMFFSTIYGRIS